MSVWNRAQFSWLKGKTKLQRWNYSLLNVAISDDIKTCNMMAISRDKYVELNSIPLEKQLLNIYSFPAAYQMPPTHWRFKMEIWYTKPKKQLILFQGLWLI